MGCRQSCSQTEHLAHHDDGSSVERGKSNCILSIRIRQDGCATTIVAWAARPPTLPFTVNLSNQRESNLLRGSVGLGFAFVTFELDEFLTWKQPARMTCRFFPAAGLSTKSISMPKANTKLASLRFCRSSKKHTFHFDTPSILCYVKTVCR